MRKKITSGGLIHLLDYGSSSRFPKTAKFSLNHIEQATLAHVHSGKHAPNPIKYPPYCHCMVYDSINQSKAMSRSFYLLAASEKLPTKLVCIC